MRSVSKLLQEGTTTPRLYSPKPGGLRKKTRPAPLLNMRLTPRPNLDQPDTPPSRRSGLSQPSSSSKPTLRTPSPAKVGLIVVSHELPYQCQNGNCAKSYKKEEFERLTDGSEWYSGRANHAHTFPFGTTIGKRSQSSRLTQNCGQTFPDSCTHSNVSLPCLQANPVRIIVGICLHGSHLDRSIIENQKSSTESISSIVRSV